LLLLLLKSLLLSVVFTLIPFDPRRALVVLATSFSLIDEAQDRMARLQVEKGRMNFRLVGLA
jgi:hypothetical protein